MSEPLSSRIHNKVGFHTGPGTNVELLVDYVRRLDSAGVPVFLTAVSAFEPLQMALEFTQESRVDHNLIYAFSPEQLAADLADFNNADFYYESQGQEQEWADRAWRFIKGNLPPGFERERVWLEFLSGTQEAVLDRQADWLGEFAVLLARHARSEGLRLAFFGWASGNPRAESWAADGMMRLLHQCQQYPDQLAISLHEFGGSTEGRLDGPGSGIGRFQNLLDACSDHEIAAPTIFLTQFGWTRDSAPGQESAYDQLLTLNEELLAVTPSLRGAALWTLAPEYGKIAYQLESLVPMITEISVENDFAAAPVSELPRTKGKGIPIQQQQNLAEQSPMITPLQQEQRPVESEEGEYSPVPSAAQQQLDGEDIGFEEKVDTPDYDAAFVNDVTIPHGMTVAPGDEFRKEWRVRNTGTENWQANFQLVFVDGIPMQNKLSHQLAEDNDWRLRPGQVADIGLDLTAPADDGDHFSHWQLQNSSGEFFGDTLVTTITVAGRTGPDTAVPLSTTITPPADTTDEQTMPETAETTPVDVTPIPTDDSSRERRYWLGAVDGEDEERLEALHDSVPAIMEAGADLRGGDLLLLYRSAPYNNVSHLLRLPPDAPAPETTDPYAVEESVLDRLQTRVLAQPLPGTLLQAHAGLAGWSPPVPGAAGQELSMAGYWDPIRDLLLLLNPELAPELAAWLEADPGALLRRAVGTTRQLRERDGRFQALGAFIGKIGAQEDAGALLAMLREDGDWRVRRAARAALGHADTVADSLADASIAGQHDQYRDVLEILDPAGGAWQQGSEGEQASAHKLLAQAYEELAQPDNARHHWQEAARLNPADTAAFAGIDRTTPDERLAESEKFFEALRDRQQDAAGPAAGLAAVAQRRNQFARAADLLAEAARHAPTVAEREQLESRREVIIQYVPGSAPPEAPALTEIHDPREKKLFGALRREFSRDELRILCAELAVNDEELRQDRLSNMAYDLVRGLSRQGRLAELELLVKQKRPRIAHLFQDSVADLIQSAAAMLTQEPQRAIRFLNSQKSEWDMATTPERATISTILARAYEAVGNVRLAYFHWQRKGLLQPEADDAFVGAARVAPADLLDEVETWMKEMQTQHPEATGPALGLARLEQRRGNTEQAAELLQRAPAASLVRQRQMEREAAALRDGEARERTPLPAATPGITANRLNLTLDDLAASSGVLDERDQVAILREFVQQTLALPTLSPAHKRSLKARSVPVIADAEKRGHVAAAMLSELHLPVLDSLFITRPAHRRALIRAVTTYRRLPQRRLALFLRAEARAAVRRRLHGDVIAGLLGEGVAAQTAAYESIKTAVFHEGTITLRGQAPRPLAEIVRQQPDPLSLWRQAAASDELAIEGNLHHAVPGSAFLRLDDNVRDFWLMMNDLLHQQEGVYQHLDSWGRYRRTPLPVAISSLLLYVFHPEHHLPYHQETAVAILNNLDLGDKARQLDYPAFMDFARNLLQDEDLAFESLDDVGYFLALIAAGTVPFGVDPTEPDDTPLHPPLRRHAQLEATAVDTVLDLPPTTFDQITSALNAGNHVILIGPPGTGKTTVAQDVCRLAHDTGCSRGYLSVTATADWTTFDTVGGYMPAADNRLVFSEGIVLRAIRSRRWLVIDEINRADIDKAFGELFTVLSGQPVTLPYQSGNQPIRILPPGQAAQGPQDYVIPATWRVIGTMNVYDKASLFEMSYAFMRRFAFVDVNVPTPEIFQQLITRFLRRSGLAHDDDDLVAQVLRSELFAADGEIMRNRPLGPAIAKDMIHYAGQRRQQTGMADLSHLAEAFLLYAVPQFDGLEEEKIEAIFKTVTQIFAPASATSAAIARRLRELFPQYAGRLRAEADISS